MPDKLFAYRLAAKLGVVDPAAFDGLTNEQWMEWQAVALIDGWHNGWLHTSQLMAHITNETNRVVLTQTDKPQQASKRMQWPTGHELAEKLQSFGKKKRTGMTPEQAQQFFKGKR